MLDIGSFPWMPHHLLPIWLGDCISTKLSSYLPTVTTGQISHCKLINPSDACWYITGLVSLTQLVVLVAPVMKETRALTCGYTYWASGRLEPFSLNTNNHKYCISVLQWMKSSMKTGKYHSCILSQIDGLASIVSAILLLCSRVCYTVKFVLYPLLLLSIFFKRILQL